MSQITVNKIQGLTTGGNANTIVLNTDSTDRVTVNSVGRVGIGTSSPTQPLHVEGAVRSHISSATQNFIATTSGGGGFNIEPDDYSAANPVWKIRSYSNEDISVVIGGAERARFLNSGGLTFNGDTAAANALDDYEEGTWTPGLTNYNGTPTTSGKYTKIGNMVYCVCNITLDGTSDTSEFWINNLPFTAASDPAGGGYPLSGTWTANFGSSSGYYIRVQPSNTYIQFRNFDGNGAISYNSMGNSSAGSFQFFYHT